MAYDKSPPPATPTNCEFCGSAHPVIFRGRVGGFKPRICGECVLGYAMQIIDRAAEFRKAPRQP